MQNLNLATKKILTFIPAGKHYERSIELYKEIGFTVMVHSPSFAALKIDDCGFILQNYQNEWALGNFMMVLEVENLDDWWTKLSSLDLEKRYEGVRMKAPEMYPWGKREIHFIDLAGVLWHIAQG
jgi:hypothetical protein